MLTHCSPYIILCYSYIFFIKSCYLSIILLNVCRFLLIVHFYIFLFFMYTKISQNVRSWKFASIPMSFEAALPKTPCCWFIHLTCYPICVFELMPPSCQDQNNRNRSLETNCCLAWFILSRLTWNYIHLHQICLDSLEFFFGLYLREVWLVFVSVWFGLVRLAYKMVDLCEVWHGLDTSDFCLCVIVGVQWGFNKVYNSFFMQQRRAERRACSCVLLSLCQSFIFSLISFFEEDGCVCVCV